MCQWRCYSTISVHCPNCVCKEKAHPFGNEYHNMVCCFTKSIFRMVFVETKEDCPKEGDYSKLEFDDVISKTATLCCHLTMLIWGTKRVCLLELVFGKISALHKIIKGIYGTKVYKQKSTNFLKVSNAKMFCITCKARMWVIKKFVIHPILTILIHIFGWLPWQISITLQSWPKLGLQHSQRPNAKIELAQILWKLTLWIRAPLLLWLSCCWWQQQQPSGSSLFWRDFQSRLLGLVSSWVENCTSSNQLYSRIWFLTGSPTMSSLSWRYNIPERFMSLWLILGISLLS